MRLPGSGLTIGQNGSIVTVEYFVYGFVDAVLIDLSLAGISAKHPVKGVLVGGVFGPNGDRGVGGGGNGGARGGLNSAYDTDVMGGRSRGVCGRSRGVCVRS